ncbi:MAG: sigma 54-interacting transcriptional regulator, partial [Desulfovibrio sp.]|nr:sigma 54-interacting transcriptional regulator [Desulfovibrio sp.]
MTTPLRMDIVSRCADEVGKKLMRKLVARAGRKAFFSALSGLIQEYFTFDRLCINLYDQHSEMLTYFTAAEGTVVSTLSPVRPADPSGTVAGHVIATCKPVIITDFARYFSESSVHPIAEAGLTVTMAFPLILDNEIIATLHCSFAKKPQNIYEITAFFLEIAPTVAICLGAVLSLEQTETAASRIQPRPGLEAAEGEKIVCYSKAMRKVMRRLDAVAELDVPLLLLGETGTGKSLFAQEIHRRSPRKERPFVRVNCPGLVPTLLESELFGHARGAFTGALAKRTGRFELADGGSLFLDEIAELAPEMQSKLLQVLEDGRFERVGESVSLRADTRVIAATN